MSVLYIRNNNGNFIQIPSIPGKSAYEIAVEKGVFEGTEQEFAEMQVIHNKDIIDQITQENIDAWNDIKEINLDDLVTKEYVNESIENILMINDEDITNYTTWSSVKIYQYIIDLTEKYNNLLKEVKRLEVYIPKNILQDANGDYLQDIEGNYLIFKESV